MFLRECCHVTLGKDTTYTWWIPWFIHKEYRLVHQQFSRDQPPDASLCLAPCQHRNYTSLTSCLPTILWGPPTLSVFHWGREADTDWLKSYINLNYVRIFSVMLKSCKFYCLWCCQKHKKSVLHIYSERQNHELLIVQNLNQTDKRHLNCVLIFFFLIFFTF